MSVSSSAIGEGIVSRLSSRTVVSNKTGTPITYVFRSFLLVGDHTMLEIRVPDGIDLPAKGAKLRCSVVLSSYKDDDEATLDEYL